MTQSIFRNSPDGAPSKSITIVVDATAGNEVVSVPLATDKESSGWPPYDRIVVIKSDASANTVTVQDATPTTLGVLEVQDDAITLFCDGLAWSFGGAVAPRITEIHTTDVTNAKVLTFSPGSATPVNNWNMAASGASDPLILSVSGTGADLDINMTPKGAGKLTEAGVPVALESGSAQAASTAILLADLVTDFNALLAKLRTARVLDP